MKLYKNTIIIKLTAFVLLTVMVFITGVKVLHHHHKVSVQYSSHISKSSPLEKSFETAAPKCAICDFEFFKNADGYTAAFYIEPPIFIVSFIVVAVTSIYYCVPISVLLRGPPAIV